MQRAPHFPEVIQARAPRGLSEALAVGARARNMTTAEYHRQALLAILSLDGIRVSNGQVERSEMAAA